MAGVEGTDIMLSLWWGGWLGALELRELEGLLPV